MRKKSRIKDTTFFLFTSSSSYLMIRCFLSYPANRPGKNVQCWNLPKLFFVHIIYFPFYVSETFFMICGSRVVAVAVLYWTGRNSRRFVEAHKTIINMSEWATCIQSIFTYNTRRFLLGLGLCDRARKFSFSPFRFHCYCVLARCGGCSNIALYGRNENGSKVMAQTK